MSKQRPAGSTTRREFVLSSLGGVTAVAVLGAACGGDDSGGGADAAAAVDANVATGDGGQNACTVYPQETQGPYYLDAALVRRDITEGKPGAPLAIVIEVLGATACAALRDVAVDIWHCDAAGVYSGYPGQLGGLDTTGQTFLRGTQLTGADGKVQFDSIFPGWYPGRTTHIHVKLHVSPTSEATSQMYFPEAVNTATYQVAPYAVHGQKDTTNAGDGTTGGLLPPLFVITGDAVAGYVATLTIVVAG